MFALQDPFFWAFTGMFGLLAGAAVVSGTKLGRCTPIGFAIVMVCDLARVILVLLELDCRWHHPSSGIGSCRSGPVHQVVGCS
jgi:hypothetical protein